ncbi:MAG: iron-containing redox enzyme family protein [Planctomycetota bacterium]|nr:iron-containing redox enzyme family protein [Planctomycetota bacterium]
MSGPKVSSSDFENSGLCDAFYSAIAGMHKAQKEHLFWDNELFRGCRLGLFSLDDFRFIFSQYYLYSKNFTRYLSGLMANLDDDRLRAKLCQNLFEESGEDDLDQRHAQLFRNFLTYGLGIDLAKINFLPFTHHFVDRFLDHTRNGSALYASSFLSLGTEAIVSQMYEIFVNGLLHAGIAEEHLVFFRIHMAGDDAHAATLAEILASFSAKPGFLVNAEDALNESLRLRGEFFDGLVCELRHRRISEHLNRIQGKTSLLSHDVNEADLKFMPAEPFVKPIYSNQMPALGIDFTVDRAPFPADVLDARVVRISPGNVNERHRHAHETVFYIISGNGRLLIGDRFITVQPGDCVFVPRWVIHQSQNQGQTPMVILAITDFFLTSKAYFGDYDSTARMRRPAEQ